MRAYQLKAPYSFVAVEVAEPSAQTLKPGELLLKPLSGGICGSDLPFFRGFQPRWPAIACDGFIGSPRVQLHEVAGRILASADPDHEVGSLVVGWASRFDALSELVVSNGVGMVPYDPKLDAAVAVVAQPLACVMYALEQIPNLMGSAVAVIGQGPIGVLFTFVAKLRGARSVIGVDRINRAEYRGVFGADEIVHASADRWADSLTDDERPDIVVEAVGHNVTTLTNAVTAAKQGGSIYYFGVADDLTYPLPMSAFLSKSLTLRGGSTFERQRMLTEACKLLADNPAVAEAYVTNKFGFGDVQAAFDAAVVPRQHQLKVAIVYES